MNTNSIQRLEAVLSEHAVLLFWAAFLLVPLFTGLLAYKWLPHESYNPATDRVLASHQVDVEQGDQDREETVYDAWQDMRTGKVYRLIDFEKHRRYEQWRMTYTWFMYGLIGCLLYAFRENAINGKRFVRSLGLALVVDIVVAGVTLIMQVGANDQILSGQ